MVFYAACLSNITPPVCVSAYAAAAIAGADPMRTGFAALKFGATLVLIPFSFVYAPGLLLYGSTFEIVNGLLGYVFGYLALAMLVQGAEPVRGPIAIWQRGAFAVSAFCLLFPTSIWIDLVGLAVLVGAWAPSIMGPRRRPAGVGVSGSRPSRSVIRAPHFARAPDDELPGQFQYDTLRSEVASVNKTHGLSWRGAVSLAVDARAGPVVLLLPALSSISTRAECAPWPMRWGRASACLIAPTWRRPLPPDRRTPRRFPFVSLLVDCR